MPRWEPAPDGPFPCRGPDGRFADPATGLEHVALTLGDFSDGAPVLLRLHSECLTGDVFGSRRCDCGPQLEEALERIAVAGGYVLYLRQEGRGIGLINKLKAYNLQDLGLNTAEANTHLGFDVDARQYDCAIFILQDLGIREVELITNNPDKVEALRRSPIQVTGRIPIEIPANEDSRDYLQAKKELMGHLLGL
mgnify:CR=1 FL=1